MNRDRSGTAAQLARLKTAWSCQEPDQQILKAVKTAKPCKGPGQNSRQILMLTQGLVSGSPGHTGITNR